MKKILFKRSDVLNKIPTLDSIDYGELLINYADGDETLYIRNSADEIIPFKSSEVLGNATNLLQSHINNKNNPHNVTKAQVGLDRVNNTSDLDKPISRLQQEALDEKINYGDVVNDLETNDSTKPLSAEQGVILLEMLNNIGEGQVGDLSDIIARLSSLEEEVQKALFTANIVINDSI